MGDLGNTAGTWADHVRRDKGVSGARARQTSRLAGGAETRGKERRVYVAEPYKGCKMKEGDPYEVTGDAGGVSGGESGVTQVRTRTTEVYEGEAATKSQRYTLVLTMT